MKTTREEFEDRRELRRALGWDPDDGTLSGGERALAAIVRTLDAHFDRLDGREQLTIASALAAVGAETTAAEGPFRDALAAAPRPVEVYTLADYAELHGIEEDAGTPGCGLFGSDMHQVPRPAKTDPRVMFHGPEDRLGNLIAVDVYRSEVRLYRKQIEYVEARRIVNEAVAGATRAGRPFRYDDMEAGII